jgi:sucrose synthase
MQNLSIEIKKIDSVILEEFLYFLKDKISNYFILRNELITYIKEFSQKHYDKYLEKFVFNLQEMLLIDDEYIAVHRYNIAKYTYYSFIPKQKKLFKIISIDKYLDKKDFIVNQNKEKTKLTIDFLPFYDYSPSISDHQDLGKGITFLSKYMSSNFFHQNDTWNTMLYQFLSIHSIEGQQLLLNPSIIKDSKQLISLVKFVCESLYTDFLDDKNFELFWKELKELGFMNGWGNTVDRVVETMKLLYKCFNRPDSARLDMFISRIPMISKIVILSPHGWFGQENILGKPDTGGQVVYLLDKVKYLEKILSQDLEKAGINIKPTILVVTRLIPNADNTSCNVAKEKIYNTNNAWIIRVPFRHSNGEIHQDWVSRFHLWPFIEKFAEEVKDTITKELNGKPDLIVGNYSDGNLVATMLSRSLGVIQCNIAHALEKSKYLFSDLYWKDMEENYNFSFQYTADLLSMNMASFIITSTFQEIAGTSKEQGQYESYLTYSLPSLCHVKSGVNLFHPKFNILHPGVPEDIFFPYYEQEKRDKEQINLFNKLIFQDKENYIFGELEEIARIPIFSLARIDKVKNLSGLIEIFGSNPELRKLANLILITDKISTEVSNDTEEKNEIEKMYAIIEKYNLYNNIRWIGAGALGREKLAELYRVMADKNGIFMQPALFEAFGLTVLEAMSSGVVTFATRFGGPSEIINDGINGVLFDPTKIEETAQKLIDFINSYKNEPNKENTWSTVSYQGIKRVQEHFNWNLYTENLLSFTRIYSFWKFSVSEKAKQKMWLYYDAIFDNLFRKRLPKEY